MSYFTEYPKISITNPINGELVNVTDIFRRLIVTGDIETNKQLYSEYYVSDGERSDQIAFKKYGDTKYYWIVLLINNITNIDDWCVSSEQLEKLLFELPNQNAIKFYKSIEIKNNKGYIIFPAGLVVSENFSIVVDGILYQGNTARMPVTFREYIVDENEKKRKIILLEPSVVFKMDDQFGTLIGYTTNILTNNGTKFQEI